MLDSTLASTDYVGASVFGKFVLLFDGTSCQYEKQMKKFGAHIVDSDLRYVKAPHPCRTSQFVLT